MWLWCEYASDNVATNCTTRKKCHDLSNLHAKFQIALELWSWIPFSRYMMLEKLSLIEQDERVPGLRVAKLIIVCHSFMSLFEYCVCQHNWVWRHFKRYIFFKTPYDLEDFFTWNQNCSKGRNNADVYLIALYNIIWRTLGVPTQRNCLVLKTNSL